jgi:cell division protein FtsQ
MNNPGQNSSISYERWVSFVFLAIVLLCIAAAGISLRSWMLDAQKVPVKYIQILGKTQYVSHDTLAEFIRQTHDGSFFAQDVNTIYESLLEQPWVYQASVRKKWPDTLQVFVVEQVPVANWNGDQLLNAQGTAFSGNLQLEQLPSMFGPNGAEQTALTGLNAMSSLLVQHELVIESLLLTERFAWQVELKNGIKINLGRQDFIERVQRFVNLYPLLLEQNKQIEYVDLRYDTGAAVRFVEETTSV